MGARCPPYTNTIIKLCTLTGPFLASKIDVYGIATKRDRTPANIPKKSWESLNSLETCQEILSSFERDPGEKVRQCWRKVYRNHVKVKRDPDRQQDTYITAQDARRGFYIRTAINPPIHDQNAPRSPGEADNALLSCTAIYPRRDHKRPGERAREAQEGRQDRHILHMIHMIFTAFIYCPCHCNV